MGQELAKKPASPAKRRLLLASVLAACWVGFLLYEVVTTANPVIVSRPQILSAPLIAEGIVTAPTKLRVLTVHWGNRDLQGEEIILSEPAPFPRGTSVLAPLEPHGDQYRLAAASTGFENAKHQQPREYRRMYPATDQARGQILRLLDWRSRQEKDQ